MWVFSLVDNNFHSLTTSPPLHHTTTSQPELIDLPFLFLVYTFKLYRNNEAKILLFDIFDPY